MVSLIFRLIIQYLLQLNKHNMSIDTCVFMGSYADSYIKKYQLAFIQNCVYL